MFAFAAADGLQGLLESNIGWAILWVVEILICGALASWKIVVPWVYGISAFVAFCAAGYILVTTHPGNLAAIVLLAIVGFGLFAAVASTFVGLLLQRLSLPAWAPLALLGLGLALGMVAYASSQRRHSWEARDIVTQLAAIRQAEMQYAAARADRAFTCNGPDLPGLPNYGWRANVALGTVTKNEAEIDEYWIYLECESSSTPHSFTLRAISTSGEDEVDLDSGGQMRREVPTRH